MIIISQDKTMILNFENIEAIGIGNPLENNDGKFKILCNTTSDNQYTMAEYEIEERAKEVLAGIYMKYSDWQSMRMIKNEEIQAKIVSGDNSKYFDIYIMPEE